MRDFFKAVARFILGPGSWVILFVTVGLAYYLAKN
jgi:hypothetical protein